MRRGPKRSRVAGRVAAGLIVGTLAITTGHAAVVAQERAGAIEVRIPDLMLTGVSQRITARPRTDVAWPAEAHWAVLASGRDVGSGTVALRDADGRLLEEVRLGPFVLPESGAHSLRVVVDDTQTEGRIRAIPAWLSVLPPLLAILLAIALREVVIALLSGVWLGALFANGYDPVVAALRTVDTHVVGALGTTDHASIVVFSLLLGGMIGVMTRSGGGRGLASLVTRRASTSRHGLIGAWLMGLVVFFDDYANALIVGSTMRPITDRLRVSREKLSFVVDATAAPVSSIAVISSWIGVEVGYIADQFDALGIEDDAFVVFLQSIPYRFYPILMIVFVFLIVFMRRDFGPMRRAELRARSTGAVTREGSVPLMVHEAEDDAPASASAGHWIDAAAPIAAVITVALVGMFVTGRQAALAEGLEPTVRNVFGSAESTKALLWASFAGSGIALLVSTARRSLGFRAALDAWMGGVRSMVLAMVILVLAWALGSVCREVQTAQFVIGAMGDWLSPGLLPVAVFLVAAIVSFATGTSWGTMAILFPLVVPLAHELAPGEHHVMLGAVSSILAGAVWGDHCSPISDTTIMSSMASACDHADHVRTQLPYALVVGLVSMVFGDLATGLGLYPGWLGLPIGIVALVLVVRFVGKKVPDYRPEAGGAAADDPG